MYVTQTDIYTILFLIFSLDIEGHLQRINHSVPQRDSHFTVPFEQVYPWYRALSKFVELLHQEAVSFKTKPGSYLVLCAMSTKI